MKTLSKYAAVVLVVGMWSCKSGQLAQKGEYDDLYFSSKDKEQVAYASASAEPLKYDKRNPGVKSDDQSQKDVNPDYVEEYAQQNRRNNRAQTNNDTYSSDDTYYDENYASEDRRFGNIRPNLSVGVGGGYAYTSPAYYDPFFDPYYNSFYTRNRWRYYDPFFYGPTIVYRVQPNVIISFGPSWGWGNRYWGYSSWNSWGYDPFFYGPRYGWGGGWNSWGYDPFWGGNSFGWGGYGGGWYNPWNRGYRGGNTVIVGNGGRDNNPTYRNNAPNYGGSSERVNNRRSEYSRNPNPDGNSGGRIATDGTTNNGSNNDFRPARPSRVNPNDTYRPERTQGDYSRGRENVNTNPDYSRGSTNNNVNRPTEPTYSRPVRPRGDDNSGYNNNRRSSDYYNNNSNSQPSYSAPRYESPRNDNYNRSNDSYSRPSNDSYSRPSRSYDNNSSGGGSSGRSSGGYSGGGSSGSSGGNSGSSGGARPSRVR